MKQINLVAKAKKGDKDAFQQLITLEKEKLYRMAYMYVKTEQDALDVFQETIYQAYTSIQSLKSNRYFSTWITRILINTALAHIKKSNKVIPVNKEMMEYLSGTNSEDEAQFLDLRNALHRLDEKYKTVLFLRYYDDLTVKEIAQLLKCPKGTVKTNIHRGLKRLKEMLEEEKVREKRRTII